MINTDYVKELKKLSLAALSDAMDKIGINGGCNGFVPRTKNKKIAGIAFTVKFSEVKRGSFAKAADYIDEVKENEIIVIDNAKRGYCTVWGEILTRIAILKKVGGTLIYGACRDVEKISRLNYPVFSHSVFMKTGKNRVKLAKLQKPIKVEGTKISPGDFIKGDESGILVIPSKNIKEVLVRAKVIEKNERKIISAVKHGMSLRKAREKFSYNFQPGKGLK